MSAKTDFPSFRRGSKAALRLSPERHPRSTLMLIRLLSAALLFSACAFACAQNPDLTLSGQLTGRDHQTYKLVPFDVPAGVDRITVEFAYTGREQKTTVD